MEVKIATICLLTPSVFSYVLYYDTSGCDVQSSGRQLHISNAYLLLLSGLICGIILSLDLVIQIQYSCRHYDEQGCLQFCIGWHSRVWK